MTKNTVAKACFALVALAVSSNVAIASGASEEMAVTMIVTIKRACDRAIRGYPAATNGAFDKWKKANSALIERAQKASYGAEGYDEFVKKGVEQMLGKPKHELQQSCRDFQKSLNAEGR